MWVINPGGRLSLLSARPAVILAIFKRAATNFAAWWTEAQWVWTVCLRLLPDSVATAIWTRALLHLTGARRREHISPVLRQLHWLPIQSRVNLKLACFVFSSLSGHAPSYLSDDIHLVSEGPRRRLRSSTDRSCVVPRTCNTFGDRSFAVAGPRVWNSLPGHLRDEDITYSSFRRELKTYWFSCNRGAMWHHA